MDLVDCSMEFESLILPTSHFMSKCATTKISAVAGNRTMQCFYLFYISLHFRLNQKRSSFTVSVTSGCTEDDFNDT